MKTNGISIAFIRLLFKFKKISKKCQQYFPIEHWHNAELNQLSYIDTISVGQLDNRQFHLKVIGRLTDDDAKQFEQFLLHNISY